VPTPVSLPYTTLFRSRLIAAPSDNVACARVLAAPGWGLEPGDLMRLCERASKGRGLALWDALQAAQGELPFTQSGKRTADLVERSEEHTSELQSPDQL